MKQSQVHSISLKILPLDKSQSHLPSPNLTFSTNPRSGAGCTLYSLPTVYISQIHELTISLRFLGIILRVLRVEVSVWILRKWGYSFVSGFSSFSITETVRGCVSLKK